MQRVARALHIQKKLHQWAKADPTRGSMTSSTSCAVQPRWPWLGTASGVIVGCGPPGVDGGPKWHIEKRRGGPAAFLTTSAHAAS
jgi:hypothetical protein